MLIFVIIVAAVLLPVIVGGVLAAVFQVSDTLVENTKEELENRDKGYNLAETLGHKLKVAVEDKTVQYREARKLAAQKAAALPRGANMGIGRLGQSNLKTAAQALDEDVLSAYKIATVNGWDAARMGLPKDGEVAAPVAAAPAVAVGKIVVIPGKDYQAISITDGMSLAEKRKARIANAKAKSAAYKAAKAAGVKPTPVGGAPAPAAAAPVAAAAAPVAAAPAAAAPAAAPAPALPDNLPPEPELVEITDGMSGDEKKAARMANTKAKSAYKKELKALGIDPKSVKI